MRPFYKISLLFLNCIVLWVALRLLHGAPWWPLVVTIVIYVHLLVIGAVKIRWNFFLPSLHSNPAKPKMIALTFDDGPAKMTAEILDILGREGVRAAFFSIGKNAVAQPAIVRRWDAGGHLIGNHSYDHGFHFDWKRPAAMVAEIEQTNEAIRAITGKTPRLFRPPYGVTNPSLAKAVARTGMWSIGWNVRSFDTTAKDGRQLLNRIFEKLRGGDIILLHDSIPLTCEILTELIQTARQKGFTFVRVDELLDIEPYV